ncbi:hypothetical protein OIDMADRAFT_20700 [Oidiodendron maius Zn]|uniref:Uncharacterized protein n=1 Tax=Oidiodendron maius (strain Zn) TaxID=913774 RepID=A0A0C3H3D7_OIDMZ|nr:hypothetical protein OIDMADRAFT_20700 [Oidiodendron maius Zn]
MLKSKLLSAIPLLILAKVAIAVDCSTHSFTTCGDGIVHWYDPDTGEICDPLDCGGGRAPPKTDVPGCPLYTGTEVPTISYLSCWTPSASASPTVAKAITTDVAPAETSSAPSMPPSTTPSTAPSTTISSLSTTQVTSRSTTSPSTTPPASLSTKAQTTSNGTLSINSTPSAPTSTPNAGSFLGGSLIVVVGAAIAAVLMA